MKHIYLRILLILCMSVLVSSCSSQTGKQIIGGAMANAVDTQVAYDKQQCYALRNQCVQGHFEEWQTSDGVMGCSCKK